MPPLCFFFFLLCFHLYPFSTQSLNHEAQILQQVKISFTDPDSVLSSWNGLDGNPCTWYGIKCNSVSNSVYSVDLSNANIGGPFPIFICRLENLSFLSLYNNSINSTLPLSISDCKSLEHLDLAQNLLTGSLPDTLPEISNLKYLDLTGNNFSGDIPESFGLFKKLEVVSLVYNLFDGFVPPFLGNISTLKMLNLSYNPFSPGPIPSEFGNLTDLEILWMTECNLVGEIPDSLGRLKKLRDLDLALNDLVGNIPSSLSELTSLIQLELYNNSLTGELPRELGNLTTLRLLDASMNNLIGTIPDELTRLPLESLNLYQNDFEGNLPASIANSPNLYELRLFGNRLAGELPPNLGKNSPMRWIDVSNNQFTGEIPPTICEKHSLEELLMIHNSFSGQIPDSLIQCGSLSRIRLSNNHFSGQLPVGFWGLPHVRLLDLADNQFSGSISKAIVGASSLSAIKISRNNFDGSIPDEIGLLDNLVELSGSNNKFSGSLPKSMVKLINLGTIDLHKNELIGDLPSDIQSLKSLNELNLADNRLSGEIPDEIGNLPVLNYLDLSGNSLSGKIPVSLQNLKLNELNLSNNMLTGEIPPLFAKNVYWSSFIGNPGLCGELEGLCDSKRERNNKAYAWLFGSILSLAGLVFIIGIIWFLCKIWNFRKPKAPEKSKWTLMSFHKLGFSEQEILDSLDEDNVIGSGASGKVYRVNLNNGEIVAVKKLWEVVRKDIEGMMEKTEVKDDAFDAEVGTLGKIRHKNIVKLWCCCTTRDCKLLVYEYMPNGSLGDLLHSNKSGILDWPIRYKIMVDSAEGLSYLHHDCVPPIVHRDIKSNNILLDVDFGARLADFGVAKIVDATEKDPKSMSIIAGSCGYIAPEYAYTLRVNEKSDIYSFGVVILELVTGKRPVDPEFGEKDLVKWVCTTLDQKGVDHVVDPKLDSCFKEEICKVLKFGLLCTSPLPINRPSMRRIVKMLQELTAENQIKTVASKDGKLTPYYYEDVSEQGSVV